MHRGLAWGCTGGWLGDAPHEDTPYGDAPHRAAWGCTIWGCMEIHGMGLHAARRAKALDSGIDEAYGVVPLA